MAEGRMSDINFCLKAQKKGDKNWKFARLFVSLQRQNVGLTQRKSHLNIVEAEQTGRQGVTCRPAMYEKKDVPVL